MTRKTPEEIKETVKAEVSESVFKSWFEEASFANKSVTFINEFSANRVKKKYSKCLTDAYGFMPRIVVRMPSKNGKDDKSDNKSNKNPVKIRPEVIHLKKVRIPKIGYAAKEMVLLNLPHKNPGNESRVWARDNGHLSLVIQGGFKKEPSKDPVYMGIPYGTKARMILYWLMSEAVLTKSRTIYLGNSFNSLLEAVGVSKNRGGKESGRSAVLKQIYSILYSSFSIQYHHPDHGDGNIGEEGLPVRITGHYKLWFFDKGKNQMPLFVSYIDLSKEFFDSLMKSPVPLDWNILTQLGSGRKASALSLDLYAWLSFESAKAQHYGKGRYVPWKVLWKQMGSEYKTSYDFAKRAKVEIIKIGKVYTDLKVSYPRGGIRIMDGSLPSVAKPLVENKKL